VSWNEVQEFIKRLNAKEETKRYRLPTEVEWVHAARGNNDAQFHFFIEDKALLALENELKQITADEDRNLCKQYSMKIKELYSAW
jgi:formylglycine-generating enzyme required for sulfatase activity